MRGLRNLKDLTIQTAEEADAGGAPEDATPVEKMSLKQLRAFLDAQGVRPAPRERVLHRQATSPNPLDHRDEFSRPALRHARLKSRPASTPT